MIGSGAGGARAAILAAKKGYTVALIESHLLGGVCYHEGCLPIKCLSASDKMQRRIQSASRYGVEAEVVSSYLHDWVTRQRQLVTRLTDDLSQELQVAGVERIHGRARFLRSHTLEITAEHYTMELRADHIIIATGLQSAAEITPSHPNIGDHRIFMKMLVPPKEVVILGGSFVGCEFASILNALGTMVTLVDEHDRLLPTLDQAASEYILGDFANRGIEVLLGASAEVSVVDNQPQVMAHGKVYKPEYVLLTGQRKARLDRLDLEKAGVKYTPDGIPVNSRLQTSVPHIYAVGDVNGITFQAHAAIAQAEVAVCDLAGKGAEYDHSLIPQCVYTYPEIAQVGMMEEEAQRQKIETISATAEIRAAAKALAVGECEGFVKLVARRDSGQLLGGVIVGSIASELIPQICTLLKFRGTVSDLAQITAPYPTFSQAIRDCAWELRGIA